MTFGQKKKRKRLWLLIGAVSLLLIIVALAPRILSQQKLHRLVTHRLTAGVTGTLEVDSLSLRWLAPPRLTGVHFSAPAGDPALEIESCVGDRTLLQLLWDRSTFGTMRFHEPTVHLLMREDGGNSIAAAMRPLGPKEVQEALAKAKLSGRTIIEDGRLVFQRSPQRPPITLETMNATLDVEASGQHPRARLHAGPLFSKVEISAALCNDLLKFVAPILADTTWVRGSVSLETDGGDFPVEQLRDSQLSGQLTIHEITAGPGPIVAQLARVLRVPDEIQLVDESVVQFELRDGEVIHQGLRFQIGRFAIESSGSVFLDESIQLIAHIVFPEATAESTELGRRLAGRHIRLPFTGTLQRPRIDWASIAVEHPFLDEFIQRVMDPADTPVLDVLREIREKRQRARQEGRPLRARPMARELLQRLLDSDRVTEETSTAEQPQHGDADN